MAELHESSHLKGSSWISACIRKIKWESKTMPWRVALKEFNEIKYKRVFIKKVNDKNDLIVLAESIKEPYCTSRPESESNTVPMPPAANHFCAERPNNSMNNVMAATHTAVYTAFPIRSMLICHAQYNFTLNEHWIYIPGAPS